MSRPILVPSRRPTGPGWDQIFFHGMGWDQISVGWELPVPRQARTGTGWDKTLMGWELPSRSRGQPILTAIIHQQHQACLAQHPISIQYLILITAEIILIN